MSKLAKVFVFAEHVDAMRELAQGAAQLGETTASSGLVTRARLVAPTRFITWVS